MDLAAESLPAARPSTSTKVKMKRMMNENRTIHRRPSNFHHGTWNFYEEDREWSSIRPMGAELEGLRLTNPLRTTDPQMNCCDSISAVPWRNEVKSLYWSTEVQLSRE
jgi:hypothetical protein